MNRQEQEGDLVQNIIQAFKAAPIGMKISIATGFAGIGIAMYGLSQDSRSEIILGNAIMLGSVAVAMNYLNRARKGY